MSFQRAKITATVMFIMLTLAGGLGTIVSIEMLVETNKLIYVLSTLGAGYITVLSFRCILVFMDEI